jgi:hypothetical protein
MPTFYLTVERRLVVEADTIDAAKAIVTGHLGVPSKAIDGLHLKHGYYTITTFPGQVTEIREKRLEVAP